MPVLPIRKVHKLHMALEPPRGPIAALKFKESYFLFFQ